MPRQLKRPKWHLRRRGSQRQQGGPSAPWRAADVGLQIQLRGLQRQMKEAQSSLKRPKAAGRALWSADRISKVAGGASDSQRHPGGTEMIMNITAKFYRVSP